jgi:hypothetical protein
MLRRLVLMIAVTLSMIVSLSARTKPAAVVDEDSLAALAIADSFLHAWQAHDEEAGILLLSDRLREHSSQDDVSIFFSTAHSEQAYEISRGRKLAPGRYQFPITLWQTSTAKSSGAPRPGMKPHATSLIVTRAPKGDWLIDKLP